VNTGTYISGGTHAALIAWALLGGFFLSADDPLPVQSTEVSLLTSAQFAALSLPAAAPAVSDAEPVPALPDPVPDTAPTPPANDDNPEREQPETVVPPVAEATPTPPESAPAPDPVEPPQPPVLTTPPADISPAPSPDQEAAAPAPAPRVAPEAAARPEPDTVVADTVSPEVSPDASAENPAEEKPATAPQEAATEIVTEAEKPTTVMAASQRPVTRPARPAATEPPATKPQSEAIAAALAAAATQTPPPRSAPSGPPLTGGEKDAFRIAVSTCWNVDVGSRAAAVTVTVGFSLDKGGKVVGGSIKMLGAKGGDDAAVGTAFGAARRAILRCQKSGYKLPSDKYSQWQDIEMTFNPDGMRMK